MNEEQASKLKPGDRVRISLLGKGERKVESIQYTEGAAHSCSHYEIVVEATVGTKKICIPYHHAYVYPPDNDI